MWNHLAIFIDIGKWFIDISKLIYLYQFFDLPTSGSDEKMSILHQIKNQCINEKYMPQIIIFNVKIKHILILSCQTHRDDNTRQRFIINLKM